jgi:mannose-6-phosphate isomerase-like protein (cupin superfamily)
MCDYDGARALPGGIGVSLLKVYDREAPDGLVGGSPHVHLACAEGYYVVAGTGAVQTLNAKGYEETALNQGSVAWFDPGTIHRLVNGGDLTILTLMSNGGLPEAGDAVLTYPPEHLADRAAYDAATTLSGTGEERTGSAMIRRNLALQGFQALRADPAELDEFYAAATRLVRPLVGEWRKRWEAGAKRLADATGDALDALEKGDPEYLRSAQLYGIPEPTETGRHGMCGRLDTY